MKRDVQEPTEEVGGRGEVVRRHPAFGLVDVHRVSGTTVLAGSDLLHHSFVRVCVRPARVDRDLSRDWWHSDGAPHIEFDLSEAQWARLVSSLNVGSGTPCTVRMTANGVTPELPQPTARSDQFAEEMKQKLEDARNAVAKLRALVQSGGGKRAMLSEIIAIENSVNSNMGFVARQFEEHMQNATSAAKIEINAYATQHLLAAGMEALTGRAPIDVPQPLSDIADGATDSPDKA